MSKTKIKTYADFVLPPSVITRVDVSRLLSEIERVDNELTAASARTKVGMGKRMTPVLSGSLEEFLQYNELSLGSSQERDSLIKQLRLLKDKAPVVHMTFAVTADPESLQRLVAWLRQSVHPQAIISVGLQPSLVAGVYLRTPNHVHDLSLRAKLKGSHNLLTQQLEALHESK